MAMWDGSLPKGLVVQAPKNLKPTTTKPPTAKELEALELARQEQAAADLELFIQDFLQRTRTSPEWSAGTVEGKEEMLADWERDVWPGWASQRFGTDQATANYTFNAITQALRRDIREQGAQRDTWGNTFQNIGQSVMQGVDQTVDFVGGGIPLAIDSWQTDAADAVYRQRQHEHDTLRANIELLEQIGDPRAEQLRRELDTSAVRVSEAAANLEENRVELAESLANYQSMVEKSERNERERQAVNPQRREDYLRQQELLARDPEAWETLEYIAENPRYLINVLAQQLPNIAVSAAAGGVTGAVARGVAGAAVRSGLSKATQAGIARAVAGSGIVASETTLGVTDATSGIIDEISAIPDDILRNHPAYANLESRGYDTQEIRAMMVAEAVAEAIPSAAMISAVTGIVGPESSLVKPLLGLTSRTGRAANMLREGAVSAVSEFVQEGGTQYAQNVGMEAFYDVATDKTQDVLEAAVTGAVVGGPFGAIGGLAAGQDVDAQRTGTAPTPVPTTATGAPSTTNAAPDATVSTVAGITVPNSISPVIAPGIAENPFYNTGTVERGERRLDITRQMDQTVEAWRDSGTAPANALELEPIFNLLREYEDAGASDADMAARITAVQAGLGLPETSTLDIATAYAQWLDRGAARPDTVVDLSDIPSNLARVMAAVDLSDIQSDLERVIQGQIAALSKRPNRTAALAPVFNAISQIESVDTIAADNLLTRAQEAVNALPGDKAVDVRKRYKNYKKDPDKYGTGRAATTTGRGGNQIDSSAAANAPATGAATAPGNIETLVGSGGTVAGAGISGAARSDAGAVAGDIRDGEPVGTGTTEGADSGRSGSIALPAGTGTDIGAGSPTGSTVERTGDDGRAAAVDGSTAARTTPIAEQNLKSLSPEQLKVYVHTVLMDAGRSVEQASRETVVLLRLLDTVSAFTGETRAQILERVRFGHMGSADRSDNTPSTPEGGEEAVQEAVALDLAAGTVPSDTGERAGNIGVPAPILGTDLSDFRYVPGQTLLQEGWHASPSLFNRFDTRYFGSGEGGAHGVGFYFAAQQSVVDEKYINLVLEKQIRRSKAGFRGQKDAVAYRYRVNIPDNLYLIKELEGFSKQDPFVQQVWQTLAEEMGPDSYLARQLALPKDGQKTGRILYLSLARDLNTDGNRFSREGELAASKLLDERGVGGIAYKDQKGNDNFVIFNSDNIEILEVESVSAPVTLKQDAPPKTLTDVLVAHLDPDSALGSIEFLSDGTTQILFGDTADASTAIHEFEHLAVNELLKIANDPTIASTPEKQQLLDDLYALAKYCKVKSPKKNATNPTAWGVDQHERAARAFERYFKEGKAPAGSGLDGLFARMKELLTALYERAKILIGHNALPEDVRAAFDRQLTGYFQETVSTSTVNNSELVAQRNAPQVVEVIQAAQSDGSLTMAENNAQGASQEAQAASEAPDAHDLLNPLVLAVEGANFADLERIANNNWTDGELAYIESEAELPNDSVWLPPTPTPLMSVSEISEQTTPQDELNALVNSFITAVNAQSVQPVAQEITNADGTVSNSLAASFPPEQLPVVSSIATSIVQRAQHLMQQAAQGVHNVRKQINAVATMNYTPVWHATRIAKFITAVKRRMHSGASADFQLWCLENLAPTLGDAYQSPAYQAFINAPNRLEGVKAKLMDDVLTPLYQWAEQAAGQIGRNPAELLQAIGKYRTLLHTLEAAPKQEQELLDAVQAAYNHPPAPNKQRDIAKAEMELFRYREFQSGDPNAPRYKVYGGRSIPECNQELAQLIADYKDAGGAGLLDEGNAYLAQAIDTTVSYLASNGLLSEQDIQGFGQWTHYTPLTIDYSSYEYSGFDIGPCMPKLNFSRYGSIKPAEDGHAALYNLLNRSIRSMGLQDLAQTMLGAYTSLMQRNDPNIEYKSVFGGEIVFANGLAVVPANTLLTLADPTQNKNRDMQSLAEKYLKQSPMWLRLPRTDNDGNTTVTPYIILFDVETRGNINRAFVHLYANEDPIPILSKLGRVTGGVAQIYTKARPLFPPINAARDIVERLTYLPSKSYRTESGDAISGAKISAQMLLFLANPANLYRIARFQFTGTSGSPYWDAYFNDFAYSGLEGGVDYDRHMIEASRAVINATIDSMKRSGVWQKMSYKARQAFRKTYGTYCHTMYSLPTVAQFVTMRRNKISVRDSAFGTTELMNLRQRGSYHTVLGAFFPFTHSISQTAGNMLHFFGLNPVALSNHPKGRKARQKAMWNWGVLAATIMGMKTLVPLIAASLANEDDEEGYNTLDSIPLGSMQAAIPLGIQGEKPGSYIKIPTGFGPIGLGAQFAIGWDRVERGRMSPHDFVFSTLLSISKTLIPNSAPAYEFEENPAAFVVSTFAPFLVQPIVQSATNTAYSGATIDYYIRPEQRASDMARPTTPEVWRELATTIYDATGGAVDVTPESVRHLVTGYCGGALQIIPAILEGDSVYGNPLHESVRQALGPLPSALGASIVYNPQMQVEQTMFYNAMDYYNDRIKSAGIYTQFTQNRPPKWDVIDWRAEVMRRAGFTPEEISDYTLLYNATQKELKNLNDDLKKQVGPLIGNNDKSEDEIRAAYLRWASDRQTVISGVLSRLYYYQKDYQPEYRAPDERSVQMLRSNAF